MGEGLGQLCGIWMPGDEGRAGLTAASLSLLPPPNPGRAVTDSINQLITMCTQQAPGQKECDNALRELEVSQPHLEEGRCPGAGWGAGRAACLRFN